jgi:hypothetical protein
VLTAVSKATCEYGTLLPWAGMLWPMIQWYTSVCSSQWCSCERTTLITGISPPVVKYFITELCSYTHIHAHRTLQVPAHPHQTPETHTPHSHLRDNTHTVQVFNTHTAQVF